MDISLIVAMDKRRGIGKDGRLPWHLPADLKLFKKITMGHHLIMGRKTWESIGRPLPGRTMIVLTRQPDYQPIGCLVASSLNEGLAIARRNGEGEVFVIGGANVFRQTLPMADRIYLSRVEGIFAADAFFPELPQGLWKTVKQTVYPSDDHDPFTFIFEILEKEPIRNQD